MKSDIMTEVHASGIAKAHSELPQSKTDDLVDLESCSELEWIVVRTRSSEYDLLVLSGVAGDVLIRGGRVFPAFRRATVIGSIFGAQPVKLGSICVGLHLEVRVDGESVVTSRIQSVSRHRLPFAEGHV